MNKQHSRSERTVEALNSPINRQMYAFIHNERIWMGIFPRKNALYDCTSQGKTEIMPEKSGRIKIKQGNDYVEKLGLLASSGYLNQHDNFNKCDKRCMNIRRYLKNCMYSGGHSYWYGRNTSPGMDTKQRFSHDEECWRSACQKKKTQAGEILQLIIFELVIKLIN